jgi:hypothetical protein
VLIHATDGRARVVDRGRYRAQRNVDDLDDAKLNVLLHGARRPHVEGGDQVERSVGRHARRRPFWSISAVLPLPQRTSASRLMRSL